MENSNFNENDLIINSENGETTALNISINNDISKSIIVKKKIKCKDVPIIIYPLIVSALLFIISLIVLFVIRAKYEITYVYEDNAYIKPKYSSHKYSSITFKNGLKLVLVQVSSDEEAGGAISYDYGYLNNTFDPGFLKLAFLVLISDNVNNSKPFINYIGEFKYEIEKYYSSFYFKILGGGFQEYLKNLSTLTYLKDDETERLGQIKNKNLEPDINAEEKRNHLLEYLVYGYNNSKGGDILPQGNNQIIKYLRRNYTKILKVMNVILSDPSKIKIVLYSHYKFSFMKKFFLKAFNNIINRPEKSNNEIRPNAYNIGEFTTNKIIFYYSDKNDNNFIEINYFLTNNITYEQLIKDSQYLNYIIYVLNQTDENSLYYELNNNENNDLKIKSLSSKYEIVLKSKIKFSIFIETNYYSYKHLNEIIVKVYNYINNIILYVNTYTNISDDVRLEELDKISEQNFTFTEDAHDSIFYKNIANDLFYKDEKEILLKQMQFSKKDFIENITTVKFYYNQLTFNNSVIFLGFKEDTINEHNLSESEFSYMFNHTKHISLKLDYFSSKLDEYIKPLYDNNYTKLLNPKKNQYISQFDSNSKLDYYEEDYNNYFKVRYKEVNESSNSCVKVFWKNDTSFHIPKILTTIYCFHPFSRPNQPDNDHSGIKANDRLYFEYILFFAYIKRAMTEQLADVFRAGNSFHIEYKENFFLIDLFFYNDIAEKAMKIFNSIISDKDKFMTELKQNFEIYKGIAFEDYNLEKTSDLNRKRYRFYQEITKDKEKILPPVYNHYNFPKEDFFNITYNDLNEDELGLDIHLIKYIFLFGYFNESKASNILQIFDIHNKFDIQRALDLAGYSLTNISATNFVKWTLNKSPIVESLNVTCPTRRKEVNRFIIFTEYSLKSLCLCNMLRYILEKDSNFMNIIRYIRFYEQKYIFLFFLFRREKSDRNYSRFINNITEGLSNNVAMNDTVDLIGDRFYYLLKGYKKISAVRHDNMFDSAWWITYDTLYERKQEDNNDLDFTMNEYQDFIKEIGKHINNQTKYIDIIQETEK